MRRRVLITTPIPTLDEVVKDLGIGKARRDSIIQIMNAGKATKRKKISAPASPSTSYSLLRPRSSSGVPIPGLSLKPGIGGSKNP